MFAPALGSELGPSPNLTPAPVYGGRLDSLRGYPGLSRRRNLSSHQVGENMHRVIRCVVHCTALGCLVLTACTEKRDDSTIAMRHLGLSEPLPLSRDDNLAVAGQDFVCLFDSYEKELACGDLSWNDTVRLGRSGAGPGELGDYGFLLSTSDGGVGFVDPRNGRISVFTRQGYARQYFLPQLLTPASEISDDGTYSGYASIPTQRPGEIALQEWHSERGELIREVPLRVDGLVIDGQQVMATGAIQLPTGDFIVRIASGLLQRLARFDSDGSLVGQLRMPELPPQFPDERDIEIFGEQLAVFPQGPRVDRAVREFADQPLTRLARNNLYRTVQMGPKGRIYVLTTNKSSTGTYVEVYSGLEYLGRAQLRGRVLAIQIADSILVALSEEMPTEGLVPIRRLEWYGFEFDSPDGQ